jgi:NADPH:quinone reductase-like Zn-dependent oxidoreductase
MSAAGDLIRRQGRQGPARFDLSLGDASMLAVVTTGNGGLDRLELREVRRPEPRRGEVLVRVLAAGVNATDVNARVGWYEGGGWSSPSPFPFIQGTDCCGQVEEAGDGSGHALTGRRVLVRPCMRLHGFASREAAWLGSDLDGAFAQYVVVPASEVFPVRSGLTDEELGVVPCSFGTAENMLARTGVGPDQHVLVTGASGGVGTAAVQLARLRGAEVTAVTGHGKGARLRELGARRTLERDEDVVAALGERSVNVVVDNVSGPGLDALLRVLRPGGRYVSSGAIAGPDVAFDKRVLYLRDLTIVGCTSWDEDVFPALMDCLERGELLPPVAGVLPLERIAEAQTEFLEKRHVGSYVLVPPRSS